MALLSLGRYQLLVPSEIEGSYPGIINGLNYKQKQAKSQGLGFIYIPAYFR
jgi:hypothetical protein